jgi:hypothetical protein
MKSNIELLPKRLNREISLSVRKILLMAGVG